MSKIDRIKYLIKTGQDIIIEEHDDILADQKINSLVPELNALLHSYFQEKNRRYKTNRKPFQIKTMMDFYKFNLKYTL